MLTRGNAGTRTRGARGFGGWEEVSGEDTDESKGRKEREGTMIDGESCREKNGKAQAKLVAVAAAQRILKENVHLAGSLGEVRPLHSATRLDFRMLP